MEKIGKPKTRDDYVEFMMRDFWPRALSMFFQHLVGGLLCLPSLWNCRFDNDEESSVSVSTSLACLGILSEIGWEVQHVTHLVYKQLFMADKPPPIMFAFAVFHHSLATGLGLPAILYYRDSKVLHRLCFDLQFAAAVAGYVKEYSKVLDYGKKEDVWKLQTLALFDFFVMVVTRGIRWCRVLYVASTTLYADERWGFLVAFFVVAALFTTFNVMLCICPAYKRCRKFRVRTILQSLSTKPHNKIL